MTSPTPNQRRCSVVEEGEEAGKAVSERMRSERMRPQDDLILEPANADDFETVYADNYNDTMEEGSSVKPYIQLTRYLENQTKLEGRNFKLRCEVASAPLILTFDWTKNNAPLETGPRRRVKINTRGHFSRLKISDLRVLDSGFYTCRATNAAGLSVNTTAVLKVTPGGSLRRPEDPPPPQPRLSLPDASSPGGPLGDDLRVGACRLYQGTACADFLRGQRLLVTTDDQEKLMDIERDVKAMMAFVGNMNSKDVPSHCATISHRITCFHKYKLCDHFPSSNAVEPLQICASDCQRVSSELCAEGFKQAKAANMLGEGSFLPDCSTLDPGSKRCVPVLGEEEGESRDRTDPTHWCFVGNGRSFRGTVAETQSGVGCRPWTASRDPAVTPARYPELASAGKFCRNPGGLKPHPWCYREDTGEEELCNVTQCGDSLFPELRRLESPVPGTMGTAPPPSSPPPLSGPGSMTQLWNSLSPAWQYSLLAGAGGGLVLLLALIICLCCCCCRKAKHSPSKATKILNGSVGTHPSYLLNNSGTSGSGHSGNRAGHPLYPQSRQASLGHGMELNALLQQGGARPASSFGGSQPPALKVAIPAISQNQLMPGEVLGEGKFGRIWAGRLSGYGSEEEEPLATAIMSLPEEVLPRQAAEAAAELERAAQLRHPNVLELLGTVNNRTLVFDFAVHGDLHRFLLMRSPYSAGGTEALVDADQLRSDQADFLHLGGQIAAGMEYLHSMGIVHGDLACRNCFITGRQVIKLGSFGFRRDQYQADYAQLTLGGAWVPLRWMPPQLGPYPVFSFESDVWAFGVTLWELHSYGTQPYFGYSDCDVGELLRNRHLLECPDSCPSRMYSLMVECWAETGGRRPGFPELAARLAAWSQLASTSPAASSALSAAAAPHPMFAGAGNRAGSAHSATSNSVPTSTQGPSHFPGMKGSRSPRAGNGSLRLNAHRYRSHSSSSDAD